ncbi:MAG: hypothetical protein KF718_22740 [Polyangiaceae bacterium]|nr:hypothetical protein [Polyangiaceae bacterium]
MKKTSRISVLLTASVVLVASLACKKLTGGSSDSTESSSTSSAASGDSTGVPECDEYLEKYSKCVEANVPEVARGPLKDSIDKMRQTYKTSAQNPAAKAGLGMGCKQALETTKQAMSQYNCTW